MTNMTKQEPVIKARIFDPLFDRTESNSSWTSFSSETKSFSLKDAKNIDKEENIIL